MAGKEALMPPDIRSDRVGTRSMGVEGPELDTGDQKGKEKKQNRLMWQKMTGVDVSLYRSIEKGLHETIIWPETQGMKRRKL